MILPLFGHLLPNNAELQIDQNVKNGQKSQPKRNIASMRLAKNLPFFDKSEKRQFMTKCIVFNQWFIDRVNSGVCVQTIENGSVILEDFI